MKQKRALKVYRKPIPLFFGHKPDAEKDLYPLYATPKTEADIHKLGERLPPDYGHTGKTFNSSEDEEHEGQPAYLQLPEGDFVFEDGVANNDPMAHLKSKLDKQVELDKNNPFDRGVSGLGVNWNLPNKRTRRDELFFAIRSLQMDRERKKLIEGHAKQYKIPKLQDMDSEMLLAEFKPEKEVNKPMSLEQADAVDQMAGLLEPGNRKHNFKALRGVGLRPGAIMDVIKEGMAPSFALNKQRTMDVANDFVNSRPTRTASDIRVKSIRNVLKQVLF